MKTPCFPTTREAKEFLAQQIVAQAARDGMPLTDVERKMLYFSETARTLSDMTEVSAEFDRDYDQDDYERKIAKIVRSLKQELKSEPAAEENWEAAVQVLSSEDHYLLVLVRAANEEEGTSKRPRGDFAWLLLTGAAIIALMFGCMWLFDRR
ncbi:MAG: hypothetical protein WA414_05895 [Acidobacteriaceae bacterium]